MRRNDWFGGVLEELRNWPAGGRVIAFVVRKWSKEDGWISEKGLMLYLRPKA